MPTDSVAVALLKPAVHVEPRTVRVELSTVATRPRLGLCGKIGEAAPVNLRSVSRQLQALDLTRGLWIDVDTEGGDINETLKIYALLRSLSVPVAARGVRVQSSGLLLFLAGDFRVAADTTSFLVHPARRELIRDRYYTAREMRKMAGSLDRLDGEFIDIVVARTEMPRKVLAKWARAETFLDPHDVIESGIVHEIHGMTPHCTPQFAQRACEISKAGIYVPRRYLTPSYREACRVASALEGAAS